ncbi:hypothetical protein FSP39_001051 [Pinctada imbricata]|uniref:Uncharacterized protein n=1 Tax=Pinctada imbricata TaxID=66713 RepID=A0AA88XT06_PINIB|nr:hypothetical protein FSP39_001051 [Pinctada imbricata]
MASKRKSKSAQRSASAKSGKSKGGYVVPITASVQPMSKVYLGKDFEHRLAEAAGNGDSMTVLKILSFKVDPNSRDENRVPAITRASTDGHFEIVNMLIDAGANVNITSNYNVTPLHAAAKGQHINCVKHLLLGGAKLTNMTTSGITPMDIAKFGSPAWEIMNDFKKGEMPEIEEVNDVPEIPDYSIGGEGKKKKKGKGKKKGGKGGKKKGGKKKGGKKKKKK